MEPLLLTDQFLNLKAGTVSVRIRDRAVHLRFGRGAHGWPSGTGLVTNAISTRTQDTQLSITGGSGGNHDQS